MPAREDPHTGYNFLVEIDGLAVAAFTECFGLTSETDVIEYREGADFQIRLIPGLTRYTPITLKRGITIDRSLWEWRKRIVDGQIDRRSGNIVLLDAERRPIARWTFREGWPSKWQGPHFDAQSSDVAIEALEIVHERLDWES
jgi:phage tail-like protein